jgi:FixJ family two-component response regulator
MNRVENDPTVFVVDDDPGIREYLRLLIESVGLRARTYGSAREFLDDYDGAVPGCLVLDVRMPGLSGLDLQDELSARKIALPIIMMSAYGEVPMAVRAMRAGAVDFIQKPFDGQALLDRMHAALEADTRAREAEARRGRVRERLSSLTPRQQAVLDGLVAGKPSKVIAAELGLSQKTVDVHRFHIMQRLQARSLPDLFRLILLARGETTIAAREPDSAA